MKTWFMAVAITVSAAVLPSQAQQTGTSKPPATAGLQKASPGQMGQIHEEVGAFLKQLSDLNAEADSAAEIARQGSEADVEKYKMKVEDIKGKIGGLATKIQEGGALTTNLKRMLTWAATQRRRLETQRIPPRRGRGPSTSSGLPANGGGADGKPRQTGECCDRPAISSGGGRSVRRSARRNSPCRKCQGDSAGNLTIHEAYRRSTRHSSSQATDAGSCRRINRQ